MSHPTDSCSGSKFDLLYTTWINHSDLWNNASLFSDFLCRLTEYDSTKAFCHQTEAYAVFIFGLLGFFGAILSVFVFNWKPFLKLDFLLYRSIGLLEIVHMTIMITVRQIQLIDRCEKEYACVFFEAHVHLAITNTCAETVDCIVLFLTVERIAACLLPRHFNVIHKKQIYYAIFAASLFVSVFFNIIQAFDVEVVESDSAKYAYVPSRFSDSLFYAFMVKVNVCRTCAIGGTLALATCLSVLGLIKTERRKRRFLRLDQRQQIDINRLKSADKNLKRTIDLCCLQLCSAVPILINHIVYAMTLQEGPAMTDVNKIAENVFRLSIADFDTALFYLKRATNRQYLRLATNFSNILAHSAHFYLYLLFCGKIRAAVYRLLVIVENRLSAFSSRRADLLRGATPNTSAINCTSV